MARLVAERSWPGAASRATLAAGVLVAVALAGMSPRAGGESMHAQHDDPRAPATAAVIERFNAALNARDIVALRGVMADDIVFENTNPAPDGARHAGLAAVAAFWEKWFAANPDARIDVEEIIVAGDRGVVRWIYRKQRDGRPWHLRGVDVFRVRDGKVVEKLSYVKG